MRIVEPSKSHQGGNGGLKSSNYPPCAVGIQTSQPGVLQSVVKSLSVLLMSDHRSHYCSTFRSSQLF